jgi:hypothetical protein
LFFLIIFYDVLDQQQAAKLLYPLPEILLLCLLAVLVGSESLTHMPRFGKKADLAAPISALQEWDANSRSPGQLGE